MPWEIFFPWVFHCEIIFFLKSPIAPPPPKVKWLAPYIVCYFHCSDSNQLRRWGSRSWRWGRVWRGPGVRFRHWWRWFVVLPTLQPQKPSIISSVCTLLGGKTWVASSFEKVCLINTPLNCLTMLHLKWPSIHLPHGDVTSPHFKDDVKT